MSHDLELIFYLYTFFNEYPHVRSLSPLSPLESHLLHTRAHYLDA